MKMKVYERVLWFKAFGKSLSNVASNFVTRRVIKLNSHSLGKTIEDTSLIRADSGGCFFMSLQCCFAIIFHIMRKISVMW